MATGRSRMTKPETAVRAVLLVLFVCQLPAVDGILATAICSSVSPDTPNRAILWVLTNDGSNADKSDVKASSSIVVGPSGIESSLSFADTHCNLGTPIQAQDQPVSRIMDKIKDCAPTSSGGRPALTANAKVVCFRRQTVNPPDTQNWAIGESDVTATDIYWKLPPEVVDDTNYLNYRPSDAFMIVLDSRPSGYYQVRPQSWAQPEGCYCCGQSFGVSTFNWRDANPSPCALGTNRASSQTTNYWFELGIAGGGSSCVDPPPASLTVGTRSFDASFCGNAPDGFLCPVECEVGRRKISHLECRDGVWAPEFKCTDQATCSFPTAANSASIIGADGSMPNWIIPDITGSAVCGRFSEDGALCRFTCSASTSWGAGRLRCNNGVWEKETNDTGCVPIATDSTHGQTGSDVGGPSTIRAEAVAARADAVRLFWSPPPEDPLVNSPPLSYEFEVTVLGYTGSVALQCETYRSGVPPHSGFECRGATMDLIGHRIRVRAVNAAGAGAWSSYGMVPCEPNPSIVPWMTSPTPEHYDASECYSVSLYGSCTVGCNATAGYCPNGALGTFRCQPGGLGSFLGSLPTCAPCEACPAPTGIQFSSNDTCAEGSIIDDVGVCTTQCEPGYTPSSVQLSCSLGTLTPPTFTCSPSPCSAPTGIAFASQPSCAEGSTISSGGPCTASCAAGYTPSVASLSCSYGQYGQHKTFVCEPSSCPVPVVSHALTPICGGGASVNHGDVCEAHCEAGYQPDVDLLNCSFGIFSPTTFVCTESPCSAPMGIVNASQPCAEGNTLAHGTACTAQCDAGYTASESALACSLGALSPPEFNCSESPCTAPLGIVNAASQACVEGADIPAGGTCTPQCLPLHNPSSSSLSCNLGQLSPPVFLCVGLPCSAPVGLANAATQACAEGVSVSHGAVCTATCQNGYGPDVLTMNCNLGELSPPSFACSPKSCAAPTTVANTASPACAEGATVGHGDACTPKCVAGFLPSAVSSSCSFGELNPSFFCVAQLCVAPVGIQDAAGTSCDEGSRITHGQVCTPSCAPGFTPSEASLACDSGTLTPATFTCVGPPCSAPTGIANATSPCAEGAEVPHAGTCTTQCDLGYAPSTASLSCSVGALSPGTFSCDELPESPCPVPSSVAGVAADPCQEGGPTINHGGTCTPQCQSGLSPSAQSLTCLFGELRPRLACNGCFAPTGIANSASSVCQEGGVIADGGTCTSQCKQGYGPSSASLSCSGSTLTPDKFLCEPLPCSAPSGVQDVSAVGACAGGASIAHGGECRTQCASGFNPSQAVLQCSLGELSPPTFTCRGMACSAPIDIENAASPCTEGSAVAHGFTCTTQCDLGYGPSVPTLSCNAGALSPTSFTCAPVQPTPCAAPTGVTWAASRTCSEGSMIPHGGACTARCITGATPSVAMLNCAFGIFNPRSFTCSGCPAPTGIINAASQPCSEGGEIAPGGACTAKCANGFAPSSGTLRCSHGALNPPSFTCRPRACTAPTVKAGVPSCLEGARIEHGGVCTPVCSPGFVSSPAQLVCGYGELEPAAFTCGGVPCDAPSDVKDAASPSCKEGGVIDRGESCTPQCVAGLVPNVTSLVCNSGRLKIPAFSCKPPGCLAPAGVANAISPSCASGASLDSGAICEARCAAGYTPSVTTLACDAGVLNPETFTCEPARCDAPVDVANASSPSCAEGAFVEHGSNCTGRCIAGFRPRPTAIACSNGQLSPGTFICLETVTGVVFLLVELADGTQVSSAAFHALVRDALLQTLGLQPTNLASLVVEQLGGASQAGTRRLQAATLQVSMELLPSTPDGAAPLRAKVAGLSTPGSTENVAFVQDLSASNVVLYSASPALVNLQPEAPGSSPDVLLEDKSALPSTTLVVIIVMTTGALAVVTRGRQSNKVVAFQPESCSSPKLASTTTTVKLSDTLRDLDVFDFPHTPHTPHTPFTQVHELGLPAQPREDGRQRPSELTLTDQELHLPGTPQACPAWVFTSSPRPYGTWSAGDQHKFRAASRTSYATTTCTPPRRSYSSESPIRRASSKDSAVVALFPQDEAAYKYPESPSTVIPLDEGEEDVPFFTQTLHQSRPGTAFSQVTWNSEEEADWTVNTTQTTEFGEDLRRTADPFARPLGSKIVATDPANTLWEDSHEEMSNETPESWRNRSGQVETPNFEHVGQASKRNTGFAPERDPPDELSPPGWALPGTPGTMAVGSARTNSKSSGNTQVRGGFVQDLDPDEVRLPTK